MAWTPGRRGDPRHDRRDHGPATDRRTGELGVITLAASVFPTNSHDLTTPLPAVDDAVCRAKDRGRDQPVTAKTR
jgi:hypothetical protein